MSQTKNRCYIFKGLLKKKTTTHTHRRIGDKNHIQLQNLKYLLFDLLFKCELIIKENT